MPQYYVDEQFAVFTEGFLTIRLCTPNLHITDVCALYNGSGCLNIDISNHAGFIILAVNNKYYYFYSNNDNGDIIMYPLPNMRQFFKSIIKYKGASIKNYKIQLWKSVAFIGAPNTGKSRISDLLGACKTYINEDLPDDAYTPTMCVDIINTVCRPYENYTIMWQILDCPGDVKYVVSDDVISTADAVVVFGDPAKCPNKIPKNKQVLYAPNADDDDVCDYIENKLFQPNAAFIRQISQFKYVNSEYLTKVRYVCKLLLHSSIVDDIVLLL